MRKALVILILLAVLSPFIGAFRDREFRELYIFIKHQPSLTFYFYSPLGESDQSLIPGKSGYLSATQQIEEDLYVTHIEQHQPAVLLILPF